MNLNNLIRLLIGLSVSLLILNACSTPGSTPAALSLTARPVPPTAPSAIRVSPTAPTATRVPPTAPTATPIPPTAPPTGTSTATQTEVPPTATSTPSPTAAITSPPTKTKIPSASLTPTSNSSTGWTDNLDTFDTNRWSKSDGWANGNPFNNGWRADHVSHSGGIMSLKLDEQPCPSGCSNKPYASGEYRSLSFYQYGRFEARFKAAQGSGMVTASLFTYTGPSDGNPWDEIDIEILGKDTTKMQTNYITNGVGGHETLVNLGFDASAAFHSYAFEWRPGYIKWYVDGTLVVTENGSRGALPTHGGRILMNMWPGIGVDGWAGTFTYPGTPLNAYYDWISYTR